MSFLKIKQRSRDKLRSELKLDLLSDLGFFFTP